MIAASVLSTIAFSNCTGHGCDGSESHFSSGNNHQVSEPIRSCTQGFWYNEVSDCCTRDVVSDPLYSCSHLGGTLSGNTCRCLSGRTVRCPEGFRFSHDSNNCVKMELTPMIPSCADVPSSLLTEDGRYCIHDVEVAPILQCPNDAVLTGEMCSTHHVLQDVISYSCPDGWYSVGEGVCEMMEEVSCDDVDVTPNNKMVKFKKCQDPCRVGKRIHHKHGRHLCAGEDCDIGHSADVMCQASACQMHIAPAAPGGLLSAGVSCNRTTHMKALADCTDGELNANGDCCVEQLTTPVVECPKGCKSYEGLCLKEKKVPSTYVCPLGFEVKCEHQSKRPHPSRCECVSAQEMEAVLVCPAGTELLPSGECLKVQPAEPYCADEGFTIGPGDVCVGVEHEPVRLEYVVTYVTEKQCSLDECVRDNVPVLGKKVRHKHVHVSKEGKTRTRCDVETCVAMGGALIGPGDIIPRVEPVEGMGEGEGVYHNEILVPMDYNNSDILDKSEKKIQGKNSL